MENDVQRMVEDNKERADIEKELQNLRDRLAATESERDKHKKRLADFQEAMWLVMGDRIMDEIVCSGAIESIAEDVMSDCDITQHSYFESAVNDVVNNYDFDEILDDNLSHKVAQVIGDGEFIVLVGPSGCGKS